MPELSVNGTATEEQPNPADVLDVYAREQASFSDRVVTDLNALLARETAVRDELSRLLEESRQRERQYRKAVAALLDEKVEKPAGPRRAKPSDRDRKRRASEATKQRVYEALSFAVQVSGVGSVTRNQLVKGDRQIPRIGMTYDTLLRALEELRADERVRIAGKARGGGYRWAPMPEPQADGPGML